LWSIIDVRFEKDGENIFCQNSVGFGRTTNTWISLWWDFIIWMIRVLYLKKSEIDYFVNYSINKFRTLKVGAGPLNFLSYLAINSSTCSDALAFSFEMNSFPSYPLHRTAYPSTPSFVYGFSIFFIYIMNVML
jgi:hypothetical protein